MNFSWLLAPETLFGSRSPDTRAAITLIRRHHSAAATKTLLPRILLRLKGGWGMGKVTRPDPLSHNRVHAARNGWWVDRPDSRRGVVIIPALLLALTGCATTHERFTPVYCVTPSQLNTLKKAEPERVGQKLTGQAQDDLKIIAGNDIALRAYSDGLLGVIQGCTGK
jgi:hypothetical protein